MVKKMKPDEHVAKMKRCGKMEATRGGKRSAAARKRGIGEQRGVIGGRSALRMEEQLPLTPHRHGSQARISKHGETSRRIRKC